MDTKKYKSVIISTDTYELIKNLSEKNDRALSATIKRLVVAGLEAEADNSLLDSELIKGGTPRLNRLLGDLRWFRSNADVGLKKYFIINKGESRAVDVLIDTISDICE